MSGVATALGQAQQGWRFFWQCVLQYAGDPVLLQRQQFGAKGYAFPSTSRNYFVIARNEVTWRSIFGLIASSLSLLAMTKN
jgi:hypothetical protein